MTPQVGKIYRNPVLGLVVECIPQFFPTTNEVFFSGKVLDPGLLATSDSPVRDDEELSALFSSDFHLFANSREDYDHAVAAGKRSEVGGVS